MSQRSATQPATERRVHLIQSTLGVGIYAGARSRSRVAHELALRPGFLSPSPEAHRRRYVRHEAWGSGYWF